MCDFIDLDRINLDSDIVTLIPDNLAKRYNAVPVKLEGNRIYLAMADPVDIIAIEDIGLITGYDIEPLQAEESAIKRAINRFFRNSGEINEESLGCLSWSDNSDDDIINDEIDLDEMKQLVDEAPIVRVFNLILSQAIAEKASEIHIVCDEEPDTLIVYYVIDGAKHEVMHPPNHIKSLIINRAKILANLDILKKNCHQDGKIYFKEDDIRHEAMVLIAPSLNGTDENVIIKILN